MSTDHILALLLIERVKLTAAIEALQGPATIEKPPGPGRKAALSSVEHDSMPQETVVPTARPKRKLSAAGRRAIIGRDKEALGGEKESGCEEQSDLIGAGIMPLDVP